MANGKIGVTTENIFPVIKQFLYSDHEIFLRELVSNAVDATQKLHTLASKGVFGGEIGATQVVVSVDPSAKTLTVTDRGIGMSADEIDRYINQIAFSGAEEFLAKYKDQAIIGHFGLGFYSAFMVSDEVEIFSQSYDDSKKSVHWSCKGNPEYVMEELDEKRDRGTSIVLHIADDCKEYAEKNTIEGLLKKYCRFLPVEIVSGKVQEWKDGKYVDTEKDNVINDTNPLWTRKPADIKDEDYKSFYSKLYPMSEEPLFWIHLNIDYPFHLTGILYFPKIRNNFEIQKNKIQLYCNQVFVTDQVEGIVPEYLTLLHGVIDSPDIPLNVSRSYLQSDSNVKKISSYITRKVADRLKEIFTSSREDYESKWDDLKVFIQYGILTDEKFAEKAPEFMLWKNTDGKYFTADDYVKLVQENQTDKNKTTVLLYVDNAVEKNTFVDAAKERGYDVLEMNGQLDNHYMNWYESKNSDKHFARVDSDIIDKLIQKEDSRKIGFSATEQDVLRTVFESTIQSDDKSRYDVAIESMSEDAQPAVITQNEFMRRMKEMSRMGGDQMSMFYGQMPDSYTLTLNASHPLVKNVLDDVTAQYGERLSKLNEELDAAVNDEKNFEELTKSKKDEELSEEEKQKRDELSKKVVTLRDERSQRLKEIASSTDKVHQIVDLALLAAGQLKGKALSEFVARCVKLL